MSASSKRTNCGPLIITTSDEEELESPRTKSTSISDSDTSSIISPLPLQDHDYESMGSPSNSSTASGPIYIRTAGFDHHAHEFQSQEMKNCITVRRNKLMRFTCKQPATNNNNNNNNNYNHNNHNNNNNNNNNIKNRQPAPPPKLIKGRQKEPKPLPMRLRAFPQSFWQQPNRPSLVSPAANYPVLPPLYSKDGDDDLARPNSPPNKHYGGGGGYDRKITVTNTDLLNKLFESVENRTNNSNGIAPTRRGRPRKVLACGNKTLVTGEDPYLLDAVTDKLFPQLNLDNKNASAALQLVTLREGDRCINLPSLSIEQNYPQMLSELVANI